MDNYAELPKEHNNYALSGKVMLCTGIVLLMALLTILCFHNYARILFRNYRRRYIRRRAQRLLSVSTAIPSNTVASEGLDPSVIKTIPTFVYSAKAGHFPPSECAVCLSEFENNELARILPVCSHTFHVDCIDMWFYSHSNCPLCRATVQADTPANPPKLLEQTVVAVEAAGSELPREVTETNTSPATVSSFSPSSSSSSPSSFKLEGCPVKTTELVGLAVLVEVPTGEDRSMGVMDMDSTAGNRTPNLKGIWSV